MAEHDAIVVGRRAGREHRGVAAGPGGLRPLVLDAAVFPRVKICAGWVTPEALADLEVDPDKYPLTIQPFDAVRARVRGGAARDGLAAARQLRHHPPRVRPLPARARGRRGRRRALGHPGHRRGRAGPDRVRVETDRGRLRGAAW